jgi:hypothetical protein
LLTATQAFKLSQALETFRDPACYCIWICAFGYAIANAGVTNFNPLIISGYGFSKTKTVLMATPQAAVAMVAGATLTAVSYKVPNVRCILWIFSAIVGMIGAIMVHVLDVETHRNASLAGVYLMGFYNVPWVFMLSLSSSNVAGATKKSFMGVSIAIIYGKWSRHHPAGMSTQQSRPADSNFSSCRQHHRTTVLPPTTSTALCSRYRRDAYCFCRYGCVGPSILRVLLLRE